MKYVTFAATFHNPILMAKKYLFSVFAAFCFIIAVPVTAGAQPACPNGQSSIIVSILTDGYGYEISWSVIGANGTVYHQTNTQTYANNTLYQTQVCVPAEECVTVNIRDTYGDGILAPGYFNIVQDGELIASGGNNYNYTFSVTAGCAAGQICNLADTIIEGVYQTAFDEHWYVFIPDSTGSYLVSTCGLDTCDTKIWIYDQCPANGGAADNTGTIFYDDDKGGCTPQANVNGYFEAGSIYYIRIGDKDDACGDTITWEVQYLGPIVGCTDLGSCNFNPLATVDDGSCLPQTHPDCPEGPDLLVHQQTLASSIYLTTINSTDPCLVAEGCLRGYGQRDIIRFSTRIDNIGEKDYFIGVPAFGNPQFTYDNCHNHFHYDGYAEYLLFDSEGNSSPVGYKNGFCVLDLFCPNGGLAKYGCGNMGISVGCADEYSSGLPCQWIDVTDTPDGTYLFVTRVNWDNAPDALGRVEKDTINNWAQVCITLDRSSGALQMTVDANCAPFVDCAGTPYGSARPDCNGDCNGTAQIGDLDANSLQEVNDAVAYVEAILADDIEAAPCNDLNGDGEITVFDASLLASCINYGTGHLHEGTGEHNHCNFPFGVNNPNDTVALSIIAADFEQGYIDIGIRNPQSRINSYQFQLEGAMIMEVENLVDPAVYPIAPHANIADAMVIGISYQDSMINKSGDVQPLCRIRLFEITADTICIKQVISAVNSNQEQAFAFVEGDCVVAPIVATFEPQTQLSVQIQPNPSSGNALLRFDNPNRQSFQLLLLDANGRVVGQYEKITGNEVALNATNLPNGVYAYRLIGESVSAAGRWVIQR